MKKITDIQIAPTNFLLDVYLGDDVDDISEHIDKIYDYSFDDNYYQSMFDVMKERKGLCHEVRCDDGAVRILLWIRDENDLITLSHEIIHVTWDVQYMTGFNFSWSSQEIQTYLHDYLMYKILKELNDE